MRLTIVHFRRRALRRRETRRAGSRMLKLRAALLVLAVAAAGCAEREAQLRDRFFPDGRQPVTEPPLVTIEDGVARAEPVTEAASIEVRIDAGPWRLYRGPISLAPDEDDQRTSATLRVEAERRRDGRGEGRAEGEGASSSIVQAGSDRTFALCEFARALDELGLHRLASDHDHEVSAPDAVQGEFCEFV